MKVVGIDIAKYHFDLHLLPEGTAQRYSNDAQGIRTCCRFLAKVRPERIVLEATGGYELNLTLRLQTDALPVIVVNPRRVEIIDSVPGLAAATAISLASQVPEFGRINRREIAALVGVAPMNRDSGQFRGKRTTMAGRGHVRSVLYMPMLTAIRCNPVIHRFYQRLLEAGKSKMTALVAAMRKLLTILNTMIRKDQLWNPQLA